MRHQPPQFLWVGPDKPLVGFAVAFGGALVVSGLVEAIRRVIAWRRKAQERTTDGKEGPQKSSSTRSAAR